MNYVIFVGSSLLGLVAALAIFYPLGAKRRSSVPSFVWWVCLVLGVVMIFYGLSHSAAPSWAPRVAVVGKSYDHFERRQGRDSHYGFRLIPDAGGEPVNIETSIIIPGWEPQYFNGRTLRVVYLNSRDRALNNEAIDIEILSGEHTGFHDSVDARPLGAWLAIPIGAALGTFGFFGLRYMKDDEKSALSDDDDAPSTD